MVFYTVSCSGDAHKLQSETMTNEHCCNCRRHQVPLFVHSSDILKRKRGKKYCQLPVIDGPATVISLCANCERYLLSTGKPHPKEYWPSMVWAFLSHGSKFDCLQSTSLSDRWSLIPAKWREWWLSSAIVLHESPISMHNPPPLFSDMTLEANAFQQTILELRWMELAKQMDSHLAYPEVRCPWGCSEFLHKCNKLPLEDFFFSYSNWIFDCYQSGTANSRKWTDCIRPDFPSSVCILENDKFLCQPTICIGEEGAQILSCRNHTIQSKERYVFPPSTITGTLFTNNSNQLSPAVCRSRTLRETKLHNFSDTYQTGVLQGGYDGIDSSYIINRGNLHHGNALALLRDSLSIKGRSDIREYVRQLSKNPYDMAYVPANIIDRKLMVAENSFIDLPDRKELRASTYVNLLDSIELQEQSYEAKSQVLLVFDEHGASEEILFDPPWPCRQLRIHPYDGFGERFVRISDPTKSFVGFLLLGIMTVVDEFWSVLVNNVKDNQMWFGWWLVLAAESLKLPGRGHGQKHKKIFYPETPRHKAIEKLELFGDSYVSQLLNLFHSIDGIKVMHREWEMEGQCESNIVIVVRPSTILTENPFWEIRALVFGVLEAGSDGLPSLMDSAEVSIFARHSGQAWWCQPGSLAQFGRTTVLPTDLENLQVAIYCRQSGDRQEELRRRYLKCLGGQSICYCGRHKVALVTNAYFNKPVRDEASCVIKNLLDRDEEMVCTNIPLYICPEKNCRIQICKEHWEEMVKEQNHSSKLVFISENDCIIGEEQEILHDSDIIMGNCTRQDINYAAYGPIEAHELATDLYGEEYNDDDSFGSNDSNEMIPTTNTARQPMGVHLHGPTDVISSPLHVLLNMQGHLLIRRNTKLRMRKKNSNFYERIVSRSKGQTVPLVYAEGLLFPDIFYFHTGDGSILGALPTALWTDEKTLAKYGIASMRQHGRNRILDPSLLCSTDPRYQFLTFDILVNLGLRGNDSRLILHRGFADRQGQDGIAFQSNENGELYGDSSENATNVHKLSALIGHRPPHYFFTQSCNQKTCRGLRVLREWTTSSIALEEVSRKYGVTMDEARFLLRESAAPYVLRSWNEVSTLWMKYIVYSVEAPLHEIEWAWWRHEFQEKQGNPSHIHAILRTKMDITTPEGLKAVLYKIRGCLADLIHYNEIAQLKEEGFISSSLQLQEILWDAEKFLAHQCHDRCQVPRIDSNGETHFVCKVPSNFWLTDQPQNHSIQPLPVQHSKECCEVLRLLSMMDGNAMTEKLLQAERHIPRSANTDSKFSPTNGKLFICFPSAQNLQFTTGYSVSAYLAKYVSELDEVAIVRLTPPTPLRDESEGITPGSLNVNGEYTALHNTKITSWKRLAEKTKNKTRHGHGRALTQMECLTVIQGDSLVTSTIQFIRMPTCAREYRAAVFNRVMGSGRRPHDIQAMMAVTGQTARAEIPSFPASRLFTTFQLTVIQDELRAPLSTDVTTYFSMRPPELRFIRQQKYYLRWFERQTVTPLFDPQSSLQYVKTHIKGRLEESEWLDGFNTKLRLRRGAIGEVLFYAQKANASHFGSNVRKQETLALLLKIQRLYNIFVTRTVSIRLPALLRAQKDFKDIEKRFLSEKSSEALPIIWHTPVYPKNRNRFMVHLLLAMGSFETEYELMLTGNLRSAFIHAGLFDPVQGETSLLNLTSRYVREFLSIQPGSTFQFDRNLCLAYSTLKEVLLANDLVETPPLPSVLHTHMVEEAMSTTQRFQIEQRRLFIDVLWNDLVACGLSNILPDKEAILHARQFPMSIDTTSFYPPPPSFDQNVASYQEQKQTLLAMKKEMDAYIDPTKNHKNVVVVGGPGTGKTTVCEMASLYAMCKGLNGVSTSIVADRAKQLGGLHVHRLASMKASGGNLTPGRMAENALAAIYRNPQLLFFWQCLDYLYIDELGLMYAELLATLDIIARYIKHSGVFMGGMLIISSMDILQLMPWQGTPIMMSINMIAEFKFHELVESVRAANCAALREICSLTRNISWSLEDIDRFSFLLSTSCMFLSSLVDSRIPEDAVFIFGRHEPCLQVEKQMLEQLRRMSIPLVISLATDEESTTGGNWHPAALPIVRKLSRQQKRKKQLVFYKNARFEFCHNDRNFQQGQLAILLELEEERIHSKEPISVWAGPPGCKDFPPMDFFNENGLTERGWKKVQVSYTTSQNETVFRGVQARRTQYGLKPRIAATIHSSMGSTLSSVVTQVTNKDDGYDYNLWEAAQVVVLLSRTRKAKDIYFVGDPSEVSEHLLQVLQRTNRFLPYIRQLLSQLTSENDSLPILQNPCMFRPCDAQLPPENHGVVYELISTRDINVMYIGETKNIRHRLTQHNSGDGGSAVTKQRFLQPWAVYAFVIGFTSKRNRQTFESIWKLRARSRGRRQQPLDAEALLHIGHEMAEEWNRTRRTFLRVIRCGHINTTQ